MESRTDRSIAGTDTGREFPVAPVIVSLIADTRCGKISAQATAAFLLETIHVNKIRSVGFVKVSLGQDYEKGLLTAESYNAYRKK